MSYCLHCLCFYCKKVDCENRCQLDCNYESSDIVDKCEDYTEESEANNETDN